MALTARSRPEAWLEALEHPTDDLVRRAMAHRSGLVVARAAPHSADHEALAAAFLRLCTNGAKHDPGCAGKLAVLEALGDETPHALLMRGATYRQPEPSWGPPVDTAGGVRARSALTLVDQLHPEAPLMLAHLLADPLTLCRSAACEGLAAWGDPVLGGALMRLRVDLAEDEPEVLSAAYDALLELSTELHEDWVVGQLRRKAVPAECAALALGGARLEVLEPLLGLFRRALESQTARVALVAVGLLRTEASIDALLEIVRDGTEGDARDALDGLAVHAHDEEVASRVVQAIEEHGVPELLEQWGHHRG